MSDFNVGEKPCRDAYEQFYWKECSGDIKSKTKTNQTMIHMLISEDPWVSDSGITKNHLCRGIRKTVVINDKQRGLKGGYY